MSRGFLICAILAFTIGVISQLWTCSGGSSSDQVRRAPSAHKLATKIFGLVALLVCAMLQLPPATQYALLVGKFENVQFASVDGLNGSFKTCMFWAGVLAFADGMLVLKLPAIASSQRKCLLGAADPPIFLSSCMSWLVKWIYCILASTALVSQSSEASNTVNYALIGAATYLLLRYIPEIVSEQGYIQELVFYRGFIDLPSSLVVAFFTPWAIAMIVHQYQVILSLACIFAALFAIPLTLTNSAILYLKTLLDAGLYETNFRLSLKQMYDGDRLAICPITTPTPRHKDFMDNETTQASSCGW